MNEPWTPESAAFAANMYKDGHSPAAIAAGMNRTPRSVIAKLTQIGLYRAAPKAGREPTKVELVGELCEKLDMDPLKARTLTAASYEALVELLNCTAG
jgi:hypothetical protein